jgi:hypothetical protein
MPRPKKTVTTENKPKKTKENWPKVIEGSHSVRTEYEDGRVEFVTDWEALKRDVSQALREYESKNQL